MTASEPASISPPPAASPPNQTTAGNYFVANYPPFSFWRKERAGEALEALAQAPVPGTPLGIYVHLPFCRKRCHFCYFKVYTGREANRDRVSQYLDALARELAIYAAAPLVAGRRPRYVYFGGGTPSFLFPPQLRELFGLLRSRLTWDEVEEVTFECEPGTLNDEKLATLRELGVTRLSLGIENFDDAILRVNGRAHQSREIHQAFQAARRLAFPQINIDLIAGMLNETNENWQSCVAKAIELAPECITIYQMEIPFNTTIYHGMHERGEIVAPVADWPTKRAWTAYAFEELEKAGYTITSAYTAVKDPSAFRFLYRDYLWRGADMVSLGVSSFGHLRGVHYQNEKDFAPYVERLQRGELPIHRALAMRREERLLREMLLQLKLGSLQASYFRDRFQVDILQRFAQPLEDLGRSGDLALENDGIRVTRQGLLRIDELLPAFYLPEHQGARYT